MKKYLFIFLVAIALNVSTQNVGAQLWEKHRITVSISSEEDNVTAEFLRCVKERQYTLEKKLFLLVCLGNAETVCTTDTS